MQFDPTFISELNLRCLGHSQVKKCEEDLSEGSGNGKNPSSIASTNASL
jgi:hypothetical protein